VTARRGVALLLVAAVLGTSCATTAPDESRGDLLPGQRPARGSDEAGLWMQMDRVEASLRTSGRTLRDSPVHDYVRGIVCRLAPEHCGHLRTYVVRTPHFNATMAPNGTMQVWTGLLLRAENEAQLAYVLGHEIGHYVKRHSIQQFRDARTKMDFTVFFQLLTAAAGVGFVGSLAQLAVMASLLEFSRDQEHEADEVGFDLMRRAGYDPGEAPRIWEALMQEREASGDSERPIFFSTHPPTGERVQTLRRLADERRDPARAYEAGRERYVETLRPLRTMLLRDEVRTRQFERTRVVLERARASGQAPAEVEFFVGELHRLRGGKDDATAAVDAYRRALALPDPPVEAWRSLGLVQVRLGHAEEARRHLERYLAAAPEADDREMILDQLRTLRASPRGVQP
jgi:predicted Zn-dependent protease